ncbi:glycosyltransferase family A protein [Microbacterium betulae]|uniref:Glycosyltransferase family A protein n=1 Tax=Microbacterium betulae TaxID=2981139 RepID=A0AA97FLC3_9MICO|nr:glycosyltransferase family A protein [Microbacterium sp. AB]WOF23557.1 glycosyltransferase family A protein [Microbacterium sp. AB]
MPLLTIVVPAHNAEGYLHRGLVPLLRVRHDIEVIVVDDGSTDGTGAIADDYARRRPDVFRVVHQANGGHGGAINTGIAHAAGDYLKVLDADDWLSIPALERTLQTLAGLEQHGGVDALFTDYVHDRVGKNNRVSRFDSVFPDGRIFGWEDTERFSRRQYLMMHAIVYRTDVVRASGLVLPEHTFYVDNLYVVVPLAHVRAMYYLPVNLYHYFIGRADQSVNADVMLQRVDQQLRVNRLALHALPSPAAVASGEIPTPLYAALLHYVEAICAVTSATLARGGTREHVEARNAFWREVKAESPWVYTRLRRGFMGASSNLPGEAGRRVTSIAYHVARRVVGFS